MSDLATSAVDSIFDDLRDRRFLKWLFDARGDKCLIGKFDNGEPLCGLDLEVQQEIRTAWVDIIEAKYTALKAKSPSSDRAASEGNR